MQKNTNKILNVFVSVLLSVLLSSCGNKNDLQEENKETIPEKEYDISIYNINPGIEEAFQKMCDEYTSRTGVIVKAVTIDLNDEENDGAMEKYMQSGNPPTIFMISSMEELNKWRESGNVLDFSNATQTEFKELANNIPTHFKLSSNTVDNFGIPCTVEGFGYLVDPKMLSSLFGGDKYRAILSDLKTCGYDEFESFVNAVKLYISSGQIYEFHLNDNSYKLLDKKSGLSEKLNGVFSFSPDNTKYIGAYMANSALASVFSSAAEANVAPNEQVDLLMDPLMRFAEMLDLVTSSISGSTSTITKGEELANNLSNTTNQSIKNFVSSKSLFLLALNSSYDAIAAFNLSMANRSCFIPIKIPISEQDIKNKNLTDKKINSSITIYAPSHYVINAKASEREQTLAQNFFVWMLTSNLAYKYIVQEFKYIPYSATESNSTVDNAFSKSMIEYLSFGHVIPAVYYGTPSGWSETHLAKNIISQYLPKSIWSYNDYQKISDYAIKAWKGGT
ncbi:MAG: extracellular solute-binding protein [Oscillospiraceae bacterium]|jgi:raffinose/stachyose/melibiose transport system substrate-binding protein|nr:extracellular solute-binding protein [Oscillospiraceae bacterium]